MCTRTILLILGLTISIQGTLEPQIVGGHNAEAGKYPYQAFIMKQSSFLCGGSIITENMILTAAHCIHRENAYNFGVVVGTYNLSLTNPAVKYSAQKLIWHPDFDPVTTLRNDIGLIWLTENINFTKNIQPIRLASVSDVGAGKKAVVTGWGKLSQVGPIAYTLQEIELNIISQLQCQRFWNVEDSQICTLTKRSEGVCNGDSGGPLVINGEQVGIVSYGKLCAQGYPDVYTKVYNYKKWIAKYTKEAGSSIEIDTNAASTVTQAWISTLLAIFTYLHFLVL